MLAGQATPAAEAWIARQRNHAPLEGARRRSKATCRTRAGRSSTPAPACWCCRRSTRGSACRRSRRWRSASPSSPRRVGALPEVVGDAGILVDPADVRGLAGRHRAVLTATRAWRDRMREAGIARARQFSWPDVGAGVDSRPTSRPSRLARRRTPGAAGTARMRIGIDARELGGPPDRRRALPRRTAGRLGGPCVGRRGPPRVRALRPGTASRRRRRHASGRSGATVRVVPGGGGTLWEQVDARSRRRRAIGLDVFFAPAYTAPLAAGLPDRAHDSRPVVLRAPRVVRPAGRAPAAG
ncbi:MAG: hypothetical protein MZV64_73025 [Ignavibacteriales bacterium]|nr:hypothetical protein [Ignavibacteriales bacterium]